MTAIAAAWPRRGLRAADNKLSVLMLMPGSGLGSAFVGQDGLPLTGQTLTAMETAHMAAPLHLFGLGGKPIPCGCGKKLGLRRSLTPPSPACRICWRKN